MMDFINNMVDRATEQRILEIENTNVEDMTLDQQFAMIREYNQLWDIMNNKR